MRRRSTATPAMHSSPAPQAAGRATRRTLTPRWACATDLLPKEFLIVRGGCGVHAASPPPEWQGGITLIPPRVGAIALATFEAGDIGAATLGAATFGLHPD